MVLTRVLSPLLLKWSCQKISAYLLHYLLMVMQGVNMLIDFLLTFSGDNVEEVFLETAKKIYQNIQDGK